MSEAPATITNGLNLQPKTETERNAEVAFLLDVDGVVTNPVEKKVTEPQIFDRIIENLTSGNPVALNTGRSNEWMIDRVIKPLHDRVTDKKMLHNFFAVGEKGLTWASFDTQGNLTRGVFNREGIPVEGYDLSAFLDKETVEHFKTLSAEAKALIAKKYSHSTFFDDSKHAMVSTEMHDGYDQPRYAQEQVQFTQELKDILTRLGLSDKFNVDPTTIATDIQLKHVGKHLGARRILDWLKRSKIAPKHYVAVGDSSSDLEMADELKAQGLSCEFNYVNPKKPLKPEQVKDASGKPKFTVVNSQAEFGNGLLEVFGRHKKAA